MKIQKTAVLHSILVILYRFRQWDTICGCRLSWNDNFGSGSGLVHRHRLGHSFIYTTAFIGR